MIAYLYSREIKIDGRIYGSDNNAVEQTWALDVG